MPDCKTPSPGEQDEKLGTVHEQLQGWVPSMASDEEIRAAFEKAFDYRGDLTVTLKDGSNIQGYIFDRKADSPRLSECVVRMMPQDRPDKISIRYSDIAALALTGKDAAAGKSFEAWVKKYKEKKARGEKNIGIEAEPLD
jgi:hypothetical protein